MNVENTNARKGGGGKGHFSLIIVGAVLALIGVSFLIGGGVFAYLNQKTEGGGFVLSNTYQVRSSTYAFVLETDFSQDVPWYFSWMNPGSQTEWVVTGVNQSQTLFVGYTKVDDLISYEDNSGIMFETPTHYDFNTDIYVAQLDINHTAVYGQNAPGSPWQQTFWLQATNSTGSTQVFWNGNASPNTMTWSPGDYALVIMNPNGAKGVQADVQLGYRATILNWLPTALIPLGAVLALVGIFLAKRNWRLSRQVTVGV
jgi:hypothetical protein